MRLASERRNTTVGIGHGTDPGRFALRPNDFIRGPLKQVSGKQQLLDSVFEVDKSWARSRRIILPPSAPRWEFPLEEAAIDSIRELH